MVQYLYCMADNITWTPALKSSGQALYLQLVDQMAQDIATGKLAVGEKLPPQRQLAWHLEINLSICNFYISLNSCNWNNHGYIRPLENQLNG